MTRRVQPPDFRYVWLVPGPSSAAVTLAVGTVGTACAAFTLWSSVAAPLSIGITIGASALTAFALTRGERRISALLSMGGSPGGGLRGSAARRADPQTITDGLPPQTPRARSVREVAMAIVPWGVIVAPDSEHRVLRWPAVRKVDVDVMHTMRGGTPAIVSSLVAVHTDREILAGRSPGAVNLERLVANLEAYAEEAARPPARDLDGREAAGDDATEPVAGALIRHAEELCASGKGAARLALPAGGYRAVASRRAPPETLAELHEALDTNLDGALADPRPLASIVAGLLGAAELVPDLLRLVSSPHPLVAAFAKAAALRLGAPHSRAGSLDELGAFLCEEDFEVIRAWSSRGATLADGRAGAAAFGAPGEP